METKKTPYHLSIEKETNIKPQHLPSDSISKILFGGTNQKGYEWTV